MGNTLQCYEKYYSEDFYYPGDDLGVHYVDGITSFKLWAPLARAVEVLLYRNEDDQHPLMLESMNRGEAGTWKLELEQDLEGRYYLFRLDYENYSRTTVDPYARAVGTNSHRGLIVDLETTDPAGWEADNRIYLSSLAEAIIYELHVRDFSISPKANFTDRGQYLAFTEGRVTNISGFKAGIDHLAELGITHVHLLPVFDFASVDDTADSDYNWGYDPYYYNVPEGSYASNPADESRIIEFKKMVKALHDHGIGVIMDVVFNHTYYNARSAFEAIAPGYFYRRDEQGNLANGSGCGNELATERPMVRKFIIDSLKYWATEYHIDGFRFDLMGLIDRETMIKVENILHQLDPSILLYGEPWAAFPPQLEPDQQLTKGSQRNLGIAVFNDDFRNALKGDNDGDKPGYVNGAPDFKSAIKHGVVGGIDYSQQLKGFTARTTEAVNYVSSHDNLTLWDKLLLTNGQESDKTRIRIDKLAQRIIFTSQGIPFIQGGEEFLRTKNGNHNSYNAGDRVNMLKWERKTRYYDTFKYYQGLIELRRKHPAFRMEDPVQIREHLEFLSTPDSTLGFRLKEGANGDSWQQIIVLYNPERDWKKFEIPHNRWHIVVDDHTAGVKPFNIFIGSSLKIAPISLMVIYN
ncbi:MAG: type I pullulanase [Bacillota bacterium]